MRDGKGDALVKMDGWQWGVALLASLGVLGCGAVPLADGDAGSDVDASVGVVSDAGGGGIDAGTTADAGSTSDAGNTSDAGSTSDAGTTSDAGSTSDAGTPDASVLPSCPAFANGQRSGSLGSTAVNEASGLVEGRLNPGVLWLHNDSGDSARIFAVAPGGTLLATYGLSGASAVDWEDLAIGPGPVTGQSYLYLGDIGDNGSSRANVVVYRVPEPVVTTASTPPTVTLTGVEAFTLVYPDGAHNAETLLVDPRNGDLYIVVKSSDGVSPVFRAAAPLSTTGTTTMQAVATLRFGLSPLSGVTTTTGGDISPGGEAIAIRTYTSAFLWRRAAGASIADALATAPCSIPLATEIQGEALGFATDGGGYYTVSEGIAAPISFFARQ